MTDPARGEIWTVTFDPTRGREQAGRRPALILSADIFNQSPAELVIVLSLSTKEKRLRSHIAVDPPEGGLKRRSWIRCEDIRSVSKDRLSKRWGSVTAQTIAAVEDRVRILLDL